MGPTPEHRAVDVHDATSETRAGVANAGATPGDNKPITNRAAPARPHRDDRTGSPRMKTAAADMRRRCAESSSCKAVAVLTSVPTQTDATSSFPISGCVAVRPNPAPMTCTIAESLHPDRSQAPECLPQSARATRRSGHHRNRAKPSRRIRLVRSRTVVQREPPRRRRAHDDSVKLKLDRHDIYNRGDKIERALHTMMDEAVRHCDTVADWFLSRGTSYPAPSARPMSWCRLRDAVLARIAFA